MADSASELESDCSSIDGTSVKAQIPSSKEQLHKRIDSLQQECKVLKVELETYKLRCKNLLEENKNLRKASVTIQAKAEQEEEFISNMLLKKIQVLKKEKEALAMNYEQEEEFLTNDLSRKLSKLKQEKVHLEKTLEQEQEIQVNKLLRKIRKLEAETTSKQADLEQLRREKIELENTLEQEQESLVNRLWKRMEKLEAEKRLLQEKLDQPVSEPPSPQPPTNSNQASASNDSARSEAAILSRHVQHLKTEVTRLKRQLAVARTNHYEKMEQYNREEVNLRNESQNIKKKYMEDVALTRTLSESESSVDMEDDKNMEHSPYVTSFGTNINSGAYPMTPRANRNALSPSIMASHGNSNRSISPMNICVSPNFANQYKSPQHMCTNCGFTLPCTSAFTSVDNPATITRSKRSPSAEIFAKPPLPPATTLFGHAFDVPSYQFPPSPRSHQSQNSPASHTNSHNNRDLQRSLTTSADKKEEQPEIKDGSQDKNLLARDRNRVATVKPVTDGSNPASSASI